MLATARLPELDVCAEPTGATSREHNVDCLTLGNRRVGKEGPAKSDGVTSRPETYLEQVGARVRGPDRTQRHARALRAGVQSSHRVWRDRDLGPGRGLEGWCSADRRTRIPQFARRSTFGAKTTIASQLHAFPSRR